MLKAVLFDLDGTLLPLDQAYFTKTYFETLSACMARHGYEPEALVKAVWAGTRAMMRNDGGDTNDAVFWKTFASLCGEKALADRPLFDAFYRNEFNGLRAVCGFNPQAAALVQALKAKGRGLILASSPLFPRIAQEARMRWAGLEPADFMLVTTYENARFCKPNPAYYAEILQKTGFAPEECLMVGNDAVEDMAAEQAGMAVFLLTDCLYNPQGLDISPWPRGGFDELTAYIRSQGGL